MIPRIESGIPEFDELTLSESGMGGIPENSSTLIYGPPKTGKSIFSYQFTYQGLSNDEPCLYITTDQGLNQLKNNMFDFQMPIEKYIEDKTLFIIDTTSNISEGMQTKTETIVSSDINNPTDIMVKVGSGVKYICKKYPRFRSVLDSSTTLLAYNDTMLILRVLKAYLMRVNGVGGTPIITYTENSADIMIETMLKSMVDNIIKLDGKTVIVEAMNGIGKRSAKYKIKDHGIIL
jgi:KaiC/GvpD/RAD55 family RecA-like ATPase